MVSTHRAPGLPAFAPAAALATLLAPKVRGNLPERAGDPSVSPHQNGKEPESRSFEMPRPGLEPWHSTKTMLNSSRSGRPRQECVPSRGAEKSRLPVPFAFPVSLAPVCSWANTKHQTRACRLVYCAHGKGTVDGRNPAPPKKPWETTGCWYLQGIRPFQGFFGGAGFRLSIVCLDVAVVF